MCKTIALLFFIVCISWSNSHAASIRVIDGDTIAIDDIKIRIAGIDAPEKKQFCEDSAGRIYLCGMKAKIYLQDMLMENLSSLTCKTLKKDKYGRNIAQCFQGSEDLGQQMVRSGNAVAYVKYSKKYVSDEEYARERKLGIWTGKFQMPWDWRKEN